MCIYIELSNDWIHNSYGFWTALKNENIFQDSTTYFSQIPKEKGIYYEQQKAMLIELYI